MIAKGKSWIAVGIPWWWLFLDFIRLSLLWMVAVPMTCLRLAPFLKAIMGSIIKAFLKLWFACNLCECFLRISFRFGNAQQYVTNNGKHCLSWRFCWWSSCFWSVGQLSQFSVREHFFCILHQEIVQWVAMVVLECWTYLLNSKAGGNTFL